MPKNLKGGNKAKKFSNKSINSRNKKDIPLPIPEENSHIAKVTGVLGDCRFNICFISDSGLKNNDHTFTTKFKKVWSGGKWFLCKSKQARF